MGAKLAIACGGLGLVVGIAATRWLTAPPPARPQIEARAETRAERGDRTIRIERGGAGADELRPVIAEEVRAALREQAGAKAAEAAPAPSAPSPTFAQTRDQVADRVAHGRWSAADRDWMRGALGDINDAERTQLTRQVIAAANRGELHVELEGPLF